jgi:DNA recombination protein RmuC
MPPMTEAVLIAAVVALFLALGFLLWRLQSLVRTMQEARAAQIAFGEEKHRALSAELNDSANRGADRVSAQAADQGERLRAAVAAELAQLRGGIETLKLAQVEGLAAHREGSQQALSNLGSLLQNRLAEQARADQELLQSTLRHTSAQLAESIKNMTGAVDGRLEQISGKVAERLDEGFKKTNETFVNVMTRLATIDQAQQQIEKLSGSVVSLQELLGDKRSRGAFGEVQLEALVRNVLPANSFEFQHTLSNGNRVDCMLRLPEPTGLVPVDAKFPLENYRRMLDPDANETERAVAKLQFRLDVRKHVDDIARKYIIANETSDGAVLFLPAEAVFAEIHAYHPEVVEYANGRRVWIVSPTTLMAILNTARAVLKDVETRKQIHVIRESLSALATEFRRFDERMQALATHIRQAHDDVEKVTTTSQKISRRFNQIESAGLGEPPAVPQKTRLPSDSGS